MIRNRRLLVLALAAVAAACWSCAGAGPGFNRQYEYEEDVTLDADGGAVVTINSSIPALVALHGLDLPVDSRARIDREAVRRAFDTPVSEVTRVSRTWRRRGRRFIQVRLNVEDIRRLSEASAFAASRYELRTAAEQTTFRQRVAGTRKRAVPQANWDGSELVAFKVHLPGRVFYHNVRDLETNETGAVERGNILRWEQRLTDRLKGVPIVMEVRMDSESILFRTVWLFAGAFAAAMGVLIFAIAWVVRRGKRDRKAAQVERESA
jgi:hypothetical protein